MRIRLVGAIGIFPILRFVAVIAMAACSAEDRTSPEAPPGPPASIRFVSGDRQADTAMATLSAPLVVEVLDSASRPVHVVPVVFYVLPAIGDNGEPVGVTFCSEATPWCRTSAFEDTAFNGRAAPRVQLGQSAGTVRVQATLPGTNLADTATLTVRPGNAARLATFPRDSSAYVGSSYRVVGRVLDQYGNSRSGEAATFDGSGPTATITADGVFHAQAIGRAFALARSGSMVDTAWITVPPRGTMAAMELDAAGDAKIVKVELDGSGLRRLTPFTDAYYGTQLDWISASEVAFDQGGINEERILIVDTIGVVRRLTPAGTPTRAEGHVAGGPGGVVYFDAWGGGDFGSALWRVSTPGAMPERIGPDPPGSANAWQATAAPDGQRLAYFDANRGGLSLLNIATGAMTPLRIDAATPRWSPSGDWIVFGAANTLHVVRPDGTGMTDVADGRRFDRRADWSPDGKWLVARSATRLELIEPQTGRIFPLGWATRFFKPALKRR